MNVSRLFSALGGLLLAVWGIDWVQAAERPARGESWRYQLIRESTYLDDCPPCGRPSVLQPLRGSFFLTLGASDPLFDRYDLRDVRLNIGGDDETAIQLTGVRQWTATGSAGVAAARPLSARSQAEFAPPPSPNSGNDAHP